MIPPHLAVDARGVLPEYDVDRECDAAAGVQHHRLIEIVFTCHYISDLVARCRSGATVNRKDYGGNNMDARDHSMRRHESQRDGCAVRCGQGFIVNEQQCISNSNDEGMPHGTGLQRFPDSDGVIPDREWIDPCCEVFLVLHAELKTKEVFQQLWSCDDGNSGV